MFNKYLGTFVIFWGTAWGVINLWCPGNKVTAEEVGVALFTGIKLNQEDKYEQREKALKLLERAIEQELSLNVRNEEGETLLNYALANDTDVALTLLRRANVDVNVANTGEKQRWTPLHVALGAGTLYCQEEEVIDEILAKNPEINARDEGNATPLHYAAAYADGSVVQKLVDRGALINTIDKELLTPLHLAALYANVASAEALLYNWSDVDSHDRDRRTSLHLAAMVGCTEIINLLLNYGADIHAIDLSKNTPLHLAVFNNHAEAMELLYACGADTQLKNWADYEPFELLVGSETRKEYDEEEKERLAAISKIKQNNSSQGKELPVEKRTVGSQCDEELPGGKSSDSPQAEEPPNKQAKIE